MKENKFLNESAAIHPVGERSYYWGKTTASAFDLIAVHHKQAKLKILKAVFGGPFPSPEIARENYLTAKENERRWAPLLIGGEAKEREERHETEEQFQRREKKAQGTLKPYEGVDVGVDLGSLM